MNKYVTGVVVLMAAMTLAVAVPASAQTNTPANAPTGAHQPRGMGGIGRGQAGMAKPFVIGAVSAVNGNTITLLGHSGFGKTTTATTTYTVDATNAKVTKSNVASSVSSIVVGDTVAVQGTVTGTNVVATTIRDGVIGGPGLGFGKGGLDKGKTGTSTNPVIAGNGQPVIAGTISTINGSTISITNNSNVVYTIDATNAKILQGNNTANISVLKTGDVIVVQGTINGTSVTASSIIDQTRQANPAKDANGNSHPGFFGGIGQFFMHLFGF